MKRDLFTATIVKRTKHGKVLIRNVVDSVGDMYRDHMWIETSVLDRMQWGTTIEFTAEAHLYFNHNQMKKGLKYINDVKKVGSNFELLELQRELDAQKYGTVKETYSKSGIKRLA